ncbi:MAG: hypothetical protein MJZ76_02280 [Bacteroidales bacterium]|nr:hypothetical protein [Bacteroidales bacterium]
MKNILTVTTTLFLSLILICCSSKNDVIAEFTDTFPNNQWARMDENIETGEVTTHFITHEFEVKDTSVAYTITMDFTYNQQLNETEIPLVFSVYSPAGEESHIHPLIKITNPNANHVSLPIYKMKYFNTQGLYKIQYNKKTSKFYIEGAESTHIKISQIKE